MSRKNPQMASQRAEIFTSNAEIPPIVYDFKQRIDKELIHHRKNCLRILKSSRTQLLIKKHETIFMNSEREIKQKIVFEAPKITSLNQKNLK